MADPILVYIDLEGQQHFVGRLWPHGSVNTQSATFEYATEWRQSALAFALEPALEIDQAQYHTQVGKALFGSIGDSSPDRWGRTLMKREIQYLADASKTTPRTLREIDFLLMVNDEARMGALRFKLNNGGPFLASTDDGLPPVIDLGRLLAAAEKIESSNPEDVKDLKDLFAPGSSLGGARPKASVKGPDGKFYVAKFPSNKDEWDVPLWEYVAFKIAERAGISSPKAILQMVNQKKVLLTERFDRAPGNIRTPYLSAMSILGYSDGDNGSYLEIADALSRYGAKATEDKKELWRRIVLNIMISNYDDHLRNHGFLYAGMNGWTLSPVFDLEPTPSGEKARHLHTHIGFYDAEASLEEALSVVGEFALELDEARKIAQEVGQATGKWRFFASQCRATAKEIDKMSTAFEHADLRQAVKPIKIHAVRDELTTREEEQQDGAKRRLRPR